MAARLLIALASALALVGGGYWWGHTATDNAWQAQHAKALEAERAETAKETQRADQAAGQRHFVFAQCQIVAKNITAAGVAQCVHGFANLHRARQCQRCHTRQCIRRAQQAKVAVLCNCHHIKFHRAIAVV